MASSTIVANKLPSPCDWISALAENIDAAVNAGKNVVIVLIARKMVRLFEAHGANKFLEDVFGADYKKYVTIVTEHALPFELQNKTPDDTEVFIVDDLMIFGDTVETVAECIYFMTKIKPKVIAMAASKNANYDSVLYNVVYPDIHARLSCDKIAAFTARNSRDMLKLQKPIDIEHTILHLERTATSEERSDLLQKFKEEFPDDRVFFISHAVAGETVKADSITVSFSNSTETVNNDFSKIRIFFEDNAIKIVSYAPNIWTDDYLALDALPYNTIAGKESWKTFKNKISINYSSLNFKPKSLTEFRTLLSFESRIDLTTVEFANFILSFENILLHLDRIKSVFYQVFGDIECNIYWDDAKYLFGHDFINLIKSDFEDEYTKGSSAIETITKWDIQIEDSEKNELLIPDDKTDAFLQYELISIIKCIGLEHSLSLIFTYLQSEFGISPDDKNMLYREDRIRAGVTFDHLTKVFSSEYKNVDVRLAVEKWIDSRIDLGVVVPKYDKYTDWRGRSNWRRYFHAGEREDILVDVARFVIAIMDNDSEFSVSENPWIDFEYNIMSEFKRQASKFEGQLSVGNFVCTSKSSSNISSENVFMLGFLIALNVFEIRIEGNTFSARYNKNNQYKSFTAIY